MPDAVYRIPTLLRHRLLMGGLGIALAALPFANTLAIGMLVSGRAHWWMVIAGSLTCVAAYIVSARASSWTEFPLVWWSEAVTNLSNGLGVRTLELTGLGSDRVVLNQTVRIGRKRISATPIAIRYIRSVSWQPDPRSALAEQGAQWLLSLDCVADLPPEFDSFVQDLRKTASKHGPRSTALAVLATRAQADAEGMRLVEFLRSAGVQLQPDPNPSADDALALSLEGATEPGAAPSDRPRLPGDLAAASHRVRWVVG